jgi:hypothetical protein
VQEGETGPQTPPAPLHPALVVLERALAPQLAQATIRRTTVVVVQADRGGVDETAVADRQQKRQPRHRARQHPRQQHVLVLHVKDVGPLGARQSRHLEAGVDVKEGVGERSQRGDGTARRALHREREPSNDVSVAGLDRRGAPVRRDDDDAVTPCRERAGQGLHAPLGAPGCVGRKVLADEGDPHGSRRGAAGVAGGFSARGRGPGSGRSRGAPRRRP